jgi:hypothetical protein
VRLDGFSSSSFDSISLLHFSSISSSLIRVEDEAGVTIYDSSFEDCVLTSGSGCILSSVNGWLRFEDVTFSSCSAVDTFYIDGDGDLAILDSRFDDENSNVSLSQPESFISHSTGEMIVSSTIFNSFNSLFKSISSSSSSSSLIRNLEFENEVIEVDVEDEMDLKRELEELKMVEETIISPVEWEMKDCGWDRDTLEFSSSNLESRIAKSPSPSM